MAHSTSRYGEEFIEQCYWAWVGAGCPEDVNSRMDIFPTEERTGRRPNKNSILAWRRRYKWRERADQIEQKAIEKAEIHAIEKKSELLIEQFKNAMEITHLALDYLKTSGFDSAASAVQAYFKGSLEARQAVGLWEIIEKLPTMSNDDLNAEILKRIRQGSEAGQLIEGEEVDKDTWDTE